MKLVNISWILGWIGNWLFPRRVITVQGDTPPDAIKGRNLYLAEEDGEHWAVAFSCPCGCADRLELVLIPESKPHWDLQVDSKNRPTLYPSIWRKTNCKSHFWIKAGKIVWCD